MTRYVLSCTLLAACRLIAGEDTFFASGTVVNSIGGIPIRQAFLRLNGPNAWDSAVLAGADGRFRFDGLKPGTYSIWAYKPGFREPEATPSFSVGPSKDDLVVRLEPLGVIKGRVTDAEGIPVSAAMVHALQESVRDGRRTLDVRRWARTNDAGEYRLWDLEPGKYFAKVAGYSARTASYIGEYPRIPSDESFAPVYYGGGDTASASTPVVVEPGSEARADFSLTLRNGYTISGTVANAETYRPARIELFRGNDRNGSVRAVFNAADGRFQVMDVVEGQYTLQISQGEGEDRKAATIAIEVAAHDVSGLNLRLAPGIEIRGVMRLDGVPLRPNRLLGLFLIPSLPFQNRTRARFDEDGTFVFPNVWPGRYRIEGGIPNTYAAVIRWGDVDVPSGADLVVDGAGPPPLLSIDLRSDGGEISGTAVDRGRPAEAFILLVPEHGAPSASRAWNGNFSIKGIAPGAYRIYAFRDTGSEPPYAEPDFARSLSGTGYPVQVAPGSSQRIELTSFSEVTR